MLSNPTIQILYTYHRTCAYFNNSQSNLTTIYLIIHALYLCDCVGQHICKLQHIKTQLQAQEEADLTR